MVNPVMDDHVPQVAGDKARRRDQQTKGTGLGLSICHAIVLAHKGTISVDNNPTVGCTFTLRLPAA